MLVVLQLIRFFIKGVWLLFFSLRFDTEKYIYNLDIKGFFIEFTYFQMVVQNNVKIKAQLFVYYGWCLLLWLNIWNKTFFRCYKIEFNYL